MTANEFRQYVHPREYPRLVLALFFAVPATLAALAVVVLSFGLIAILVGVLVLFAWLAFEIFYAQFVANSIRVSAKNYEQLHAILEEMKRRIGYHRRVDIFVYQQGEFNAYFRHFFVRRAIFVNSDLLDRGVSDDELRWLFGRFVGKLRSRQRLGVVGWMLTLAERLGVFGFFLLPFERATVYTGDRVALGAIGGDVVVATSAMNKLLVGRELGYSVNPAGLVEQHWEVRGSLFAFLARLASPHPHMLSRYVDLIGFASQRFPEQFESFTALNPSFQGMASRTARAEAMGAPPSQISAAQLTDAGGEAMWGLAPMFLAVASTLLFQALAWVMNTFGYGGSDLNFLVLQAGIGCAAVILAALAWRTASQVAGRDLNPGYGVLVGLIALIVFFPVALYVDSWIGSQRVHGLFLGDLDPSDVIQMLAGIPDRLAQLDLSQIIQLLTGIAHIAFFEAALRGAVMGGVLTRGGSRLSAIGLATAFGLLVPVAGFMLNAVLQVIGLVTDRYGGFDLNVEGYLWGAADMLISGVLYGILRAITGQVWPCVLAGVAVLVALRFGAPEF